MSPLDDKRLTISLLHCTQLFLNDQDVALLLVQEGLARVDDYASERGAKDLLEAQDAARAAKKNVGH